MVIRLRERQYVMKTLTSPTPQYSVTDAEVQAFIAGYVYATPSIDKAALRNLLIGYFQGKITDERIDAIIEETMS